MCNYKVYLGNECILLKLALSSSDSLDVISNVYYDVCVYVYAECVYVYVE